MLYRGSQKVRIEPCEVFVVSFLSLFDVGCLVVYVKKKLNSHQNMDNTS